uniref:protein timeless homolog n=1 Tax=Erigeron canadensis TaxID=72917 RepID=UPI001CB9AC7C|nr:protein timeless homolog [Erigeron canadensis]
MENLSYICGGLGIIEEDDDGNPIGYTTGEYCSDNLKDLLRFLRRDDPEGRQVFKQVCKWSIVGKDILPIIQYCQHDNPLVLNAVKVLVFLTMPVEPTSKDIPQQIEYLWGLKSLITSSHAIPVIVTLLESPLEHLEGDLFTEDDWKLVQLVITLFRNILAVQDITMQQRVAGSASEFILLRDRFLKLLFDENVMDLILVLTQHVGGASSIFRQDNLLLLETYYYIYKGQVPELIARAHLDANKKVEAEADATAIDLKSLMEEEKAKRRQTILCNLGSRSTFSGSFTRVTMDGSKVLVKGNPCADSHELLKGHKNPHGSSKKMLWESGRMPTTNNDILRLLHDFTNQFLLGGYNILMQSIREDIEKEHHAIENNDVTTFFQVAEFVMSFQNHKLLGSNPKANVSITESSRDCDADSTLFKGSICGSISETMNESMFLLVVSKWRTAFDGLKETNNYTFLSAAGSLIKTMINMLDLVLKLSPEESNEPQTARVLLYKLFYDQTDQGMTYFLFSLIKAFNPHKQPKSDLSDLVETIHIVIRLMENLQSRGTLRVAKKSRKKRKKKASAPNNDANREDQATAQNNAANGVDQVTHQNNANDTDQVIDQNEDLTVRGEKDENMSILEKELPQGSSVDKNDDDISPGESDQAGATKQETEDIEPDLPQTENKSKCANPKANDDYFSDVSSSDEQQDATNEVDFKASSLVSSLANGTIIQNLCWLLKFYKSNSIRTNHYIICALRRICEDLELSPMLYQLSLLIIFNTILEEQKLCSSKEYENIVSFLTCLVRRMLRKMKSDPLLFVEVLFWKTRKECHYINCESMLQDLGKMRNDYRKRGDDPSHEDLGETATSGRNGWVRKSLADALGDDEADVVVPLWGDGDQSEENPDEAQVQKTSKRTKSNFGEGRESMIQQTDPAEELNKEHPIEQKQGRARKRLKPLVLDDALVEKLKDLFEKYKEFPDCSQRIVAELNLEVLPAQISKKLKEMGLKVSSKRRTGDMNVSSIHGNAMDTSPQQPMFVRKRVRAFSEDQEMKIKTLFEQFKGQKKCNQMIASALDGEGTFTAAQISRKLRQLGLRLRKQKSSDDLHLRDEDGEEDTTVSDGETLSSLKKRSKTKQNVFPTEEIADQNSDKLSDDSDNIALSSFRNKSKRFAQTNHTNNVIDAEVNQVGSGPQGDAMIIESFRSKTTQKLVLTEEIPDQNSDKLSDDSDNIVLSSAFRTKSKRLSQTNHTNNVIDAEVNQVGSGPQGDAMIIENEDYLEDHGLTDDLADELTDFGSNASPVTAPNVSGPRRKLRMVIDADDED